MNFRFHQTTVSDNLVTSLFKIFKKQKTFDHSNITKNCCLTLNLIPEISVKFRTELTGGLFRVEDVHHLHVLEFTDKGVLDYHDHFRFERYSYVLHMDDIGGTLFQDAKDDLFFKSRKGKLIIFDSAIPHKAVSDNKIRYTAAGGIIKK